MHDYFSLFNLPLSFDIDTSDLEKRYFSAQRQFHPDRLVGKTAAERQQAIIQSMLVNEAYEALKDPLKRAQHLLALEDITSESIKPSQTLLMEIMELRENLMEANSLEHIATIGAHSIDAKNKTLTELSQAFKRSDLSKAAELAMRLSYLVKMEDEVRIKRKAIAS